MLSVRLLSKVKFSLGLLLCACGEDTRSEPSPTPSEDEPPEDETPQPQSPAVPSDPSAYQICMRDETHERIARSFSGTLPQEDMQAVCNKCPNEAAACAESGLCYAGYVLNREGDEWKFVCGTMTECLDDLYWPTLRNACGTSDASKCRNYLRDVHVQTHTYNQVLTSELMTQICDACRKEVIDCLDSGCAAGGAPGDCVEVESCVESALGRKIDFPCLSEWGY